MAFTKAKHAHSQWFTAKHSVSKKSDKGNHRAVVKSQWISEPVGLSLVILFPFCPSILATLRAISLSERQAVKCSLSVCIQYVQRCFCDCRAALLFARNTHTHSHNYTALQSCLHCTSSSNGRRRMCHKVSFHRYYQIKSAAPKFSSAVCAVGAFCFVVFKEPDFIECVFRLAHERVCNFILFSARGINGGGNLILWMEGGGGGACICCQQCGEDAHKSIVCVCRHRSWWRGRLFSLFSNVYRFALVRHRMPH